MRKHILMCSALALLLLHAPSWAVEWAPLTDEMYLDLESMGVFGEFVFLSVKIPDVEKKYLVVRYLVDTKRNKVAVSKIEQFDKKEICCLLEN